MNQDKMFDLTPEPVDVALPDVKDMLTWTQPQRVVGFRNDYRQYAGDVFRPGDCQPLPVAARQVDDVSYSLEGTTYSLADYRKRCSVTGLLVLKDGHIVHEFYGNGNTPTTLWTSRSVAKSVVSTLVGIAINEGAIGSLDDLITKYEPDFGGSAWDNVTLRQLITHTSGVEWTEGYRDAGSDFAKLTAYEAGENTYPHVRDLVRNLKRKTGVKPGEAWEYSTGGAWLLGDVLERATGMTIAQYLEQKIWKPFGMASPGVWHSYDVGKHDCGGHGFNATLQDWGRFGLFVQRDGIVASGRKMLPDGWARDARTWTRARGSVNAARPHGTYGYQWWNNSVPATAGEVGPQGASELETTLWALGIFGQMIAVNQALGLAMVQWATWERAEPTVSSELLEGSLIFNAFAAATS